MKKFFALSAVAACALVTAQESSAEPSDDQPIFPHPADHHHEVSQLFCDDLPVAVPNGRYDAECAGTSLRCVQHDLDRSNEVTSISEAAE